MSNKKLPYHTIYFHKATNLQIDYIYNLQSLYTHTINVQRIIYMQEAGGQTHIDQYYRSKLYSLYTSINILSFNDYCECQQKIKGT